MHASLEQLLDIKDGVKTAVDDHVAECHVCQQTLEQIKQTQFDLMALKESDAPANSLQRFQVHYHDIDNQLKHGRLVKSIYTLAASIVFSAIILVGFRAEHIRNQTQLNDEMLRLKTESNIMEKVILAQSFYNTELSSSTNEFKVEQLKWRLMLIDQKIENLGTNNTEEKLLLWQDRVRALKALNNSIYDNQSDINQTRGEI